MRHLPFKHQWAEVGRDAQRTPFVTTFGISMEGAEVLDKQYGYLIGIWERCPCGKERSRIERAWEL